MSQNADCLRFLVKPGASLKQADIDPSAKGEHEDKTSALKELEHYAQRLIELQYLLYRSVQSDGYYVGLPFGLRFRLDDLPGSFYASFGFVTAYPMNWWLASNHMKHGLMTVRAAGQPASNSAHEGMQEQYTANREAENTQPRSGTAMHGDVEKVSRGNLVWMIMLSLLVFTLGLAVQAIFDGE